MQAFEKIGALFDGFPSPRETIRRAAVLLQESFPAEGVSFLLHDPKQENLVFEVVQGGAQELAGQAVPDGNGLAWWSFRHGYVEIEDCAADERFFTKPDDATGFCTRNLVALPFGYRGDSLGVIELVNVPSESFGNAEKQALVKLLAGHIGVAYAASLQHHRLALQKQELESANASLEQKVADRTSELRETLQRLQDQNDLLQRTQSQFMQTEKMAALGQLAAGVAHEINNPIGFIASNLNTAREYFEAFIAYMGKLAAANPPTADVYRRKYDIDFIAEDTGRLIVECLEGTARVTNIVRNLKEFAHQRHGEVDEVGVHELIDRTLSIALSPFKHKVTVHRDYGGPASWVCDAQTLGQVILNLTVNAAQAIPENGEITLRTFAREDALMIEVEDTGTGIPEENLSRIFEPFFTTKEVGVGTGLGLSTCFHLLHQVGGELSVESVVGKGSTFRIRLPEVPMPVVS